MKARLILAALLFASAMPFAQAASPTPPPGASSCSGCHAASRSIDTPVPRLVGRRPAEMIVGDAIPRPLAGEPGDAARGRAIVTNRQLCLLCHSGPFAEATFQGTLAPSLAGAGSRWSASQLRLRIVDASRLNPNTIMPPYYRTDDLTRVAPAYAGKPILSAEQVEDVVAFLATLRD